MPSNASHRIDAVPKSPADIQSTTSISSKAEAGDGRPAPRSWTRSAVKNGQSGGAITKPVIVRASARLRADTKLSDEAAGIAGEGDERLHPALGPAPPLPQP